MNNFNTSNVQDMNAMFYIASKLKNITYGENFIHKEGAYIGNMFLYCPANKPTHESWNGVTW